MLRLRKSGCFSISQKMMWGMNPLGRAPLIKVGDCIHVRRSPFPVRLLVPPDRNRFEVMRNKLRWGTI